MKKYRFDYIDDWISDWSYKMKTDANCIQRLPFGVSMPFIDINENGEYTTTLARDYSGDIIEDVSDWLKQREIYCKELVKRNKNK